MKQQYLAHRIRRWLIFIGVSILIADGSPATSSDICQDLCVEGFNTKRLKLYQTPDARTHKRLKPAQTRAFKKNLPIKIISKSVEKGKVHIRLKDGTSYWVDDYHVKINRTLTKFAPNNDGKGIGGPKVGASRGYGTR